jgi:hypothetical protein
MFLLFKGIRDFIIPSDIACESDNISYTVHSLLLIHQSFYRFIQDARVMIFYVC